MLKCITKYLDAKAERERRQTEAVTAMLKTQTEFMMTVSKFYLDKEKLKLQKEAITPKFETGGIVPKNKNKTEIIVNGNFAGNKEILKNIKESLQEKKPRKFQGVLNPKMSIPEAEQVTATILEAGNTAFKSHGLFFVECNIRPNNNTLIGLTWEEVTDEH